MRLHNRQIKATFLKDTELMQWPVYKRMFYLGLFQLSDDSGCLEDSPLSFKVEIFPSPADGEVTVDVIRDWCNEMIESGKLVSYTSGGKACLYLMNFHKHQTLKNADKPQVPLPDWIEWQPFQSNSRAGKYQVSQGALHEFLQSSYGRLTDDLQSSSNLEPITREPKNHEEIKNIPSPDGSESVSKKEEDASEFGTEDGGAQSDKTGKGKKASAEKPKPAYSDDFETFWSLYPRSIDKRAAYRAWTTQLKQYTAEDLISAAKHYALYCKAQNRDKVHIKHAATFLGKSGSFEEFIDSVPEDGELANTEPRGFSGLRQFANELSGGGALDDW